MEDKEIPFWKVLIGLIILSCFNFWVLYEILIFIIKSIKK